MAKDEDTDTGEEAGEKQLADRIKLASKTVTRHLIVGMMIIPVLLILFVVGLINLVSFHNTSKELALQEPDTLVQVFSVRIDAARSDAERQYAVHLDKMTSGELSELSKIFVTLYDVSQTSERDYVRLLSTYQQLAYESASRVKGSGEWYFYYKEKIKKLNDAASKREKDLIAYLDQD